MAFPASLRQQAAGLETTYDLNFICFLLL